MKHETRGRDDSAPPDMVAERASDYASNDEGRRGCVYGSRMAGRVANALKGRDLLRLGGARPCRLTHRTVNMGSGEDAATVAAAVSAVRLMPISILRLATKSACSKKPNTIGTAIAGALIRTRWIRRVL